MARLLYFSVRADWLTERTFIDTLRTKFDVKVVGWKNILGRMPKPGSLDGHYRTECEAFKPNVVLFGIQRANVLSPSVVKQCRIPAINWTADERVPVPDWYFEMGKVTRLSMFSSLYDVAQMRQRGLKAELLQIGVEPTMFSRDIPKVPGKYPEVIFTGSDYKERFPLSEFRRKMIRSLARGLREKFRVYGKGWTGFHPLYGADLIQHLLGAKIGINLSHYDLPRCTSNRIYQIMGVGTFCLSHRYKAIEADYEVGKHLAAFTDEKDALVKAQYYLLHEEERKQIADAGYNHVHTHHSWANRAEQLMGYIQRYCG